MAISRSLMNRQLYANGGIMQVAPREKFGLGSSIKKFVRKIIPNEVAEVAVKAAPFVAPFNPAVAAAMSGLGTFDQTGSIGDSLKGGALTYGLGQGARYLGGADFQALPGTKDFGGLGGFTEFSSPLGNQTGFKLGKPIQEVQGVGVNSEGSYLPFQGEEMNIPSYSEQLDIIQKGSPNQMTITESIQKILSPNTTINEKGGEALNLLKRGSKALFTKSDGKGGTVIDKAAVLGAVTAAASYAEAKALAADVGVDLTEEEYDESLRDEKKAEYAGYLTNFFGGKKDGGRIGFESGANEMIKTQLLEEIMPEQDGEEMITIMTEDGPIQVKKSVYESMPQMFMDTTTSVFGDAGRGRKLPEEFRANGGRIGFKDGTDDDAFEELDNIRALVDTLMREEDISESEAYEKVIKKLYAKGGRVSRKFGSPKEGESEIGIMAIDVEAGDDDDMEDMDMAAGISFNSAEKSYLFRKLGGGGGASRSFTMPQLYKILNNPGAYPNDAKVLKELTIGLGLGKKDGGRIGLKGGSGSSNRVAQLILERDYLLSKDEDVSYIDAELESLGYKMKSEGGVMDVKMPTGKIRKNNAGVVERDYRDEGGFVPVGIKERADDVPAMLSKNEFVMTADAVRGIGNGSVEEGSKKLYNTMKQAEKVGKA